MMKSNTYSQSYFIRLSVLKILLLGSFLAIIIPQRGFAQCNNEPALSSSGASIASSGTSGLCLFCSVSNTNNVINANTQDYASISIPVGVGGRGYIRVKLPRVYPAGTRAGFVADVNGGLAGLFQGVTLIARRNGSVVDTKSSGSFFNLLGLGGETNINTVFCAEFDEIEISMGSFSSLLASYNVYYGYVTEGCTFPTQCGAAPSTEICDDYIDNDGDGLVDYEDDCQVQDTDGDGVIDSTEDVVGTDPEDACSFNYADITTPATSTGDCDGDGVPNGYEINGPDGIPLTGGDNSDPLDPCDPVQAPGYVGYDPSSTIWQVDDCDGDGISNTDEVFDGTDPYDPNIADNDGDGVEDNIDIDPLDPCVPSQSQGYVGYVVDNFIWQVDDCDGDGISNYEEAQTGTDPYLFDAIDEDGDGVLDYLDDTDPEDPCVPEQSPGYIGYIAANLIWSVEDCDGDGISNGDEDTNGTDPYLHNDVIDSDGDSVPDSIEDGAPNGGDGNQDGTLDKFQNSVASLPTQNGSYVTVSASGLCTQFSAIQSVPQSSLAQSTSEFSFPFGLIDYTLTCGLPGQSATVDYLWHGTSDLDGFEFVKYGKTSPGGLVSSFFTFASNLGSMILGGGQSVGTSSTFLVDGVLGDDTGIDGQIVDPSGPAIRNNLSGCTSGSTAPLMRKR